MTRYRVPVADLLLTHADYWREVEGFRLVSADGPWLAHPSVIICTFDDDNAPPELEGKLVEPHLQLDADGRATIAGRRVIE